MLWQPSLPEAYRRLAPDDLARAIDARRAELGSRLVVLGHHYQTDEVVRHADHTGDSLKLSQIAAGLATQRPPDDALEFVVFCGVHFMAESADMLTPDRVRVILPDLSAGCSMADMAQYDDTVQAWDAMHASLREGGWGGRIIPVTYVNSSAAIKAFVGERGGACCTSSNAREVLRWALAGGERVASPGEDIRVLFLPDQHLGRNTAAKEGIDVARNSAVYDPRLARRGDELGGMTATALADARIILWAGHCSVHKLFRPEHCAQVRERDRAEGTSTTILVHPECAKEVVDLADLDGSTEFIIRTIRDAPAGSRWAVGTEVHLVSRLAREAAPRGVDVRILSDCQCLCTTMYRIDEPHLLWVLDNLVGSFEGRGGGKEGRPRVVNEIRVPPAVRDLALRALDRMLALSPRTPGTALRMAQAD
ncbi:MAG: quinolinate synthase NadA [Planctomycetota bacterium]|nr:quinolinate synthase NadA [Planctomycetota bacterium]